jgi:hypothetical protein
LLLLGLVLPFIMTAASYSSNFVLSIFSGYGLIWVWMILVFEALSLSVTPLLIYLYCTETIHAWKKRSRAALIITEIALYLLVLLFPYDLLSAGFAGFVTLCLFCAVPIFALGIGLGLRRIESRTLYENEGFRL